MKAKFEEGQRVKVVKIAHLDDDELATTVGGEGTIEDVIEYNNELLYGLVDVTISVMDEYLYQESELELIK